MICEKVDEKTLERWKHGNLELGVAVEDVNLFLDFVSERIDDMQGMIKNEEELKNDDFSKKKIDYAKLEVNKIKKRLGELYFLL
jgi:hypothetical protein